jgi:transcriptional regulator with XRE-family HTH domain
MAEKYKMRIDGAVLSNIRIESGKSMQEVAMQVGCNKGEISKWERGMFVPSEAMIVKMAFFFRRTDFIVIHVKRKMKLAELERVWGLLRSVEEGQ